MHRAPLSALKMHVYCGGAGGVGGPSLGPSLLFFFQDKAKGSLLAGRPCPLFALGSFPRDHREVWSPEFPEPGSISEVSSLSEHAFPCGEQAGGQQGLSKLSDPWPERPGRKGVQPVACKALVGTC